MKLTITLSERTEYHTRLQRCSLEVEHCRAYWRHAPAHARRDTDTQAFENYWFGARTLPRVRLLLCNFRERFDRFPPALTVLHRWTEMQAVTRRLICHWHLQLADRLYREFTGNFLVNRVTTGWTMHQTPRVRSARKRCANPAKSPASSESRISCMRFR